MSPAEGLHTLVEGAVLGALTDFALRIGRLTDGAGSSHREIVFIDHPGSPPETIVGVDYPSVQVIVRGAKSLVGYQESYLAIKAVTNFLHLLDTTTPPISYPELVSCLASTGIAPLGNDAQDRPQFSVNFRLITQPADPGNRQ